MRCRWKDGFPRISTSRRTLAPSQASRVPWRTWRQRPTTRSVPMPSLPRIRRTRPRGFAEAVAPRAEPRVAELSANGLTWIHLDPPIDPETVNRLRERFGWHPLDVEDVMSKRQRPKVDDYADEGYLFGVLHFPIYDRASRRLNAAELDVFVGPNYLVTLPSVELLPVSRLFRRCEEDEQFRDQLLSKGSGRLL